MQKVICDTRRRMRVFSTREAAKKLGLQAATLARYVAVGKLPAPKIVHIGATQVHAWTEREIERVRKLLPKLVNGRKTRWQKERAKKKGPKKSNKKK